MTWGKDFTREAAIPSQARTSFAFLFHFYTSIKAASGCPPRSDSQSTVTPGVISELCHVALSRTLQKETEQRTTKKDGGSGKTAVIWSAVVWVYLREAGGFLFLFVTVFVFFFFFFLDCWRLRWLEGCVQLWLSSWVFSESMACWGRTQHQLVSIRLCRMWNFKFIVPIL